MPSRARIVSGGLMVATLGAYAIFSLCVYLSYHWSSTWDRPLLQRSGRIDPWNAEPWRRLGHLDLFSAQAQDARSAAEEDGEAVRRNPLDAYAWLQLALARQALADNPDEMRSLERALASDSTSPAYLLAAAQEYLSSGEQPKGLALLRALAEHHPASLPAAVTLAWRATHSASTVVDSVIPTSVSGQLFLLGLLSEQQESVQADWLWSHIAAQKTTFASSLAAPYVEFLLQQNRGAAALDAWRRLAQMDGTLARERDDGNLVINPGFEADIQNALLDWRYRRAPAVAVEVDPHKAHGRARSLQLQFSGAVTDVGIVQYVPVTPGTRYELSGFYCTLQFEGAGGLAWAVVDAATGAQLVQTPPLAASTDWQAFSVQFQVPAAHDLVRLQLVRAPAGDQLRGSVWFDDLGIRQR